MNSVFISYSKKDYNLVLKLYRKLTENGIDCFFDKISIEWGDNWVKSLEEGLEECESVILCLSPSFNASSWTSLERTSVTASITERKLLPLVIKKCAIPKLLSPIKYLDISSTKKFNDNFPTICKKLKKLKVPLSYKQWLISKCSHVDISKLHAPGKAIRVELPSIFIPLYSKSNNKCEIEELIARNQSLLIKGHAGTGKTTLIKHLSYRLMKGDCVEGLEGYIPILIFLKELNTFLITNNNNSFNADDLLTHYFSQQENVLDIKTINDFLKSQKALFLLDGLDEVYEEYRDVVVTVFNNKLCKHVQDESKTRFKEKNKIAISSRPHGLHSEAINVFGSKISTVLPLNMDQIECFIKKWFNYINRETNTDIFLEGNVTAKGLIEQIKAHDATRELMDNPLMLTAICLLYYDGKELPNQRSELYKKFVTHLIYCKFEGVKDRRRIQDFLQTLSFRMHSKGMKSADRSFALKALKHIYKRESGESQKGYNIRAELLLDELDPKCGLLKRDRGSYRFWHLTFQEFFTALYLIDNYFDYGSILKKYWNNDNYKEVIKLFIGQLSIEHRKWVSKIIGDILKSKKPHYNFILLASYSLNDIHEDYREEDIVRKTQTRLISIFKEVYSPKIRNEAGRLLGLLGDPRDLKEFIKIHERTCFLEESGRQHISSFKLGKYLVTNSWYEEFINNHGYKNREYWSDDGWKWREENEIDAPKYWNDKEWKWPNSPVVGVSWFEVNAFASWLTEANKDQFKYRLPTEVEWRAAAAGRRKCKYPWGNKWDSTKCNSENQFRKTTSVGMYENGKTETGLYDMAGNVWEWTSSYCNMEIVGCGGSWNDIENTCSNDYRSFASPDFRHYITGFRLAIS